MAPLKRFTAINLYIGMLVMWLRSKEFTFFSPPDIDLGLVRWAYYIIDAYHHMNVFLYM